jgi:hypothetical protein
VTFKHSVVLWFSHGTQANLLNNSVPVPTDDKPSAHLVVTKDVERMTLQNVNFTSNSAEVLLHLIGYSFKNPIKGINMTGNNASGIFFEGAGARFDGDKVEMEGISAKENMMQTLNLTGRTATGVVVFKGVTSNRGKTYSIVIHNSTFEGNWAQEHVRREVRESAWALVHAIYA